MSQYKHVQQLDCSTDEATALLVCFKSLGGKLAHEVINIFFCLQHDVITLQEADLIQNILQSMRTFQMLDNEEL